jgi:hypothetical protein
LSRTARSGVSSTRHRHGGELAVEELVGGVAVKRPDVVPTRTAIPRSGW